MVRSEEMTKSYDDKSEEARVKRTKTATKTQAKRRQGGGEDDGPQDKRQNLQP